MSTEKIATAKAVIANSKRKLTLFVNFLEKYEHERDSFKLEKWNEKIEISYKEFETAQTEIETFDGDPNLHESVRNEFDEKYFDACAKAAQLISRVASRQQSMEDNPEMLASSMTGNIIRENSARNQLTSLPRVSLPSFNGTFDTWLGFRDLFQSIIDKDAQLRDIEKLYYLKGCLRDTAADLVASIEMTSENYRVAWELLEDRFNNPKLIRQTHVQALLNLSPITRDFSVRTFLDEMQKNIRSLEALKEPVKQWDTLLVEIMKNKLGHLREKWEEFSCDLENPTCKDLATFLQRRAQFEDTKSCQNQLKNANLSDRKPTHSRSQKRQQNAYVSTTNKSSCPYCQGEHSIFQCENFKKLSPQEAFKAAKGAALCINCLRPNHRVIDCTSSPCRKCHKKHHSLLHFEKSLVVESSSSGVQPENKTSVSCQALVSSDGLLATAIVDLVNTRGKTVTCRVFLDPGSQVNFITERVTNLLNLPREPVDITVSGVEDICTGIKHLVTARLKSRFNKFEKLLEFYVFTRITQQLPSTSLNRELFEIPKNIVLADPNFHQAAEVDILLGVKHFFKLLCVGQIALKNHPEAVLQKTQLGWIVAGEVNSSACVSQKVQCTFTKQVTSKPNSFRKAQVSSLNDNLIKFWEVEEIPALKILSAEERECEEHYKINTKRTTEGRYTVRLPFRENKENLGRSYAAAYNRFKLLENRFARDPNLKEEYVQCLSEYESLNHMSALKDERFYETGFFLPHHAVIKGESLTTKTRVVFDGSVKSSSGISLNDTLMKGPTIQSDLFSLLTRFRTHRVALTADLEKMYRQVLIHPDDSQYQKILFRRNSDEPIETYTLNTVTFGTSCAPFLAVRTLYQLAHDERTHHPIAAATLERDFYVDDLISGANSREEALLLQRDLTQILSKGGFTIRKWASNDPSVVQSKPEIEHLSLNPDSTVKTLGIQWNPSQDTISYSVKISVQSKQVTKRSILSQVAKLFDPLGLLGPIIIKAKIIIQSLWKAGILWDETIPLGIHTAWLEFRNQLPLLTDIKFDRLIIAPNAVEMQIHGFCDASERAYGACIYLVSIDVDGSHSINLICSKSRVAPLNILSLPRLELLAALLLSRLYAVTRTALKIQLSKSYLWSDSMIALQWIKMEPYKLKTFIANRVTEIQELTSSCEWRHVSTQHNPADLISRGQTPKEFLKTKLWKEGPSWLRQNQDFWPENKLENIEVPEKRLVVAVTTLIKETLLDRINKEVIEKGCRNFEQLVRIIAYVFRFIEGLKRDRVQQPQDKHSVSKLEQKESSNYIMKSIQAREFHKEIQLLSRGLHLEHKNQLSPLNPFIDSEGILRVGGRLAYSEWSVERKHPILLPADHPVTKLIVRGEHIRLLHAGTQATLYSIREQYWIINGRNVIRKEIRNCLRCFRVNPQGVEYLMGNLPRERLTYSRPFVNVGVDYCGPLYIKEKRFRNQKKVKVYVAIFVCMGTKAVHLELVSDATTEAFIACLKRLFSRRGISKSISSDNGRNFVGASREIIDLYELFQSKEHEDKMKQFLDKQKISWKFSPPFAPHFGGLWEAAVKSFKYHLLRIVGETLLTFEQLETCVIEIEAILNSRPISPMSSDPNDLQPLTPGHFLIGGPLTSFPQIDYTDLPSNRLSNWQHIQRMRQHFWNRWQKEYLNELNIRTKWKINSSHSIQPGSMVVIKEDNTQPLQWVIGRVVETHPGKDGIIRVAKVKTNRGEYTRCIKKLCPLPIDCSETTAAINT